MESYVDLVDIEDCRSRSYPLLLSLLAANERKIYVDRIKKNRYHDLRPAAPPCVAAAANREQR
jgi:hypothetical protein